MKLVFVGNSGSGKTTLAERMGLELGEAMHYTNLKELYMPTSTDTFDTILNAQEKMRNRILETILYTEGGCYDRSLFDQYCYSNRYIGDCLSKMNEVELVDGRDYFGLLKKALAHLKWSRLLLKREHCNVDLYFYCESLKEYNKKWCVEDDTPSEKKRWGDLTLQCDYDILVEKMLPREKTHFVMASGLEERVGFCVDIVRNKLNGGC